MSLKTLSIVLMVGIILSACGGQLQSPATETPTAAPASATPPPSTATPTATEETVAEDTPTATLPPTETPPDNPADCVNKASFVSDVTIPDNSNVITGVTFTKTWRVQNSGTCIWWSGYTLTHYSDERMSAPDAVPLKLTNPGETIDISVDLVAPSVPGTYRGNFVIENPEGLIMQVDNDSRLWLIINVVSEEPPDGTAVPTGTATTGSTTGTSQANASCSFTTDATRVTNAITALNNLRAQNNLPALTADTRLTQAAQRHSNDMACNQFYTHDGTDGSTPETRIADAGYAASEVTENVYGSSPPLDGQGVIDWWANDRTEPSHRRNLLSTQYSEVGMGYSFFNNFGYYVIVFASP